jgi:hypothetical protein
MAKKKKKATLIAVREKVKKPKAVKLGVDYAEAWVDKTRLRGERRRVSISLDSRESSDVRILAAFCKQAADWMDDDK